MGMVGYLARVVFSHPVSAKPAFVPIQRIGYAFPSVCRPKERCVQSFIQAIGKVVASLQPHCWPIRYNVGSWQQDKQADSSKDERSGSPPFSLALFAHPLNPTRSRMKKPASRLRRVWGGC